MLMNDAKLGRLDDLLISTDRYSLEAIDGLFSAALVGPVETDVESCLAIFEDVADAMPWPSEAIRDEAYGLLHEFWAVIAARVAGDPMELAEDALPFIDSPEELGDEDSITNYTGDFPLASDWAVGFRFAMDEWEEAWSEWMDDAMFDFVGMLMTLSSDQTDSQPGEVEITAPSWSERLAILNAIPFQLAALYRRRHPEHGRTFRRDGEKAGRNDACSCGSGKKYKKCCGAG